MSIPLHFLLRHYIQIKLTPKPLFPAHLPVLSLKFLFFVKVFNPIISVTLQFVSPRVCSSPSFHLSNLFLHPHSPYLFVSVFLPFVHRDPGATNADLRTQYHRTSYLAFFLIRLSRLHSAASLAAPSQPSLLLTLNSMTSAETLLRDSKKGIRNRYLITSKVVRMCDPRPFECHLLRAGDWSCFDPLCNYSLGKLSRCANQLVIDW